MKDEDYIENKSLRAQDKSSATIAVKNSDIGANQMLGNQNFF